MLSLGGAQKLHLHSPGLPLAEQPAQAGRTCWKAPLPQAMQGRDRAGAVPTHLWGHPHPRQWGELVQDTEPPACANPSGFVSFMLLMIRLSRVHVDLMEKSRGAPESSVLVKHHYTTVMVKYC